MDVQQQLNQIEKRLQHIETMLGVKATTVPIATKTPPSAQTPESRPVPPTPRQEDLSLLGASGIICVVLAALYLVKLAVDAGWLTPFRQLALAASFGLGLIVLGFKIKTKDREYLSYLPAAGITILYLSALGGCLYHHLYDPLLALLFCGAISAGCIYIYSQQRRFAYLVLSTMGAYLTPFLLGNVVQTELIQSYFLVVTTAYTVIAVLLQDRPITLLGAYFALFTTAAFGFSAATDTPAAIVYLGLQAIIVIVGTLYHTLSLKRPLDSDQALMFFPLILFFYGLEYAFLDRVYPELAPYISILFAGFLLALYSLLKEKLPKDTKFASEDVLMSSAFIVLTHSFYFVLTPEIYQPLLFTALFATAAYFYNQVHWPTNWRLFRNILQVTGMGLLVWNYALVLFSLLFKDEGLWKLSGFLLSIGLLGLLKFGMIFKKQGEDMPALLYTPHILMASSLYAVLKSSGSFAVSAAWAVYALAVLGYGYKTKDKTFAKSSMVILILSSLKVFFFDLSGANTLVRVLCLLVTGMLLYTSGWMFRKI
jgi:uncharacterized membrane protein